VFLGTFLFFVLVILLLAVLVGAGGYSVRRYWSPAGSEVVETSDSGGAGAGIAAAILALLVLILLFFGFTQWNWFGARQGTTPSNNPTIASPAPTSNTAPGGGAVTSPAPSPTR
jgi:hypothetical protein